MAKQNRTELDRQVLADPDLRGVGKGRLGKQDSRQDRGSAQANRPDRVQNEMNRRGR